MDDVGGDMEMYDNNVRESKQQGGSKWEAHDRYNNLSCGASFFRMVLIGGNALTLLLGFILLGYSIYIISKEVLHDKQMFGGAILVLLILSLTIIVVSMLGCIGAKKESACTLILYNLLLMVIQLFLIGISAFMWTKKGHEASIVDSVWGELTDDMIESAKTYFHCCPVGDTTCTAGESPWQRGECEHVLVSAYHRNLQGVITTVALVIVTLLCTFGATLYLIRALKNMSAQFTTLSN